MTASLVSVIMPCFNMGCFVGDALASVAAQSYAAWEVIAVDDCGPADATRPTVLDFARKFPGHRVQYIRHETNRGVGAARNTAVKASTGEWLAFLDPDDLWLPMKLEQQVARLRDNPFAVACFALGWIKRQGAGCLYAPGTEIMGIFPSPEHDIDAIMVANRTVMFPFSSVLLRRAAFDQVGGFQEALPFQNEDRLLIGCAASFGSITGFAEPLCIYRVHDNSITTSVIKSGAANMIEFDLSARIALWLRSQQQSRLTGLKMIDGAIRGNLRTVLQSKPGWKWSGVLVKLCARLVAAYPGQSWSLAREFFREMLLRASGFRIIRRAIRRLAAGNEERQKTVKK